MRRNRPPTFYVSDARLGSAWKMVEPSQEPDEIDPETAARLKAQTDAVRPGTVKKCS